jgi:hypothetical protein
VGSFVLISGNDSTSSRTLTMPLYLRAFSVTIQRSFSRSRARRILVTILSINLP